MAELFATCDGLHDLADAVAEGDGEHCSKFRSDEVRNGASCEAKHDRACSFTRRGSNRPAILMPNHLYKFSESCTIAEIFLASFSSSFILHLPVSSADVPRSSLS
jgi:hypothetical protein